MRIIKWKTLISGDFLKRLFMVCIMSVVIFALMVFTLVTAFATSCPNCGGVGEPTGAFCDLCDSCGSCLKCGYACIDCCDDGRRCGECCCEHCGDFCNSCGGCLKCGDGCDPECPDFGDAPDYADAPAEEKDPHYRSILDIDDDPLPLLNAFGRQFFFFAPVGVPYWSILSVLLTIAGAALSIVTILRAVNQKKKENKNVDNQCSAMLRNVDSFNNDVFIDLLKHKEQYNEKRRLVAFALMNIFSFSAVLILLIVQDFRGVIALFDWWVITHAVLFISVVICRTLVFRKSKGLSGDSNPASS